MPEKLPPETLPKLRAVLTSGRLPDNGDPGYNDVYDTWGELTCLFDQDWNDRKNSPARRHVAALVDLWSAIPTDGLVVGVAVNQPGVVPAAQEAAAAMSLPTVAQFLPRIQACIPEEIRDLYDVTDRINWYHSEPGKLLAATLEEIEEELQNSEFATELMEACFRRLLAEPQEFFES